MTLVRFRRDGYTKTVTFIRWSTTGIVLLDMWWCSYSKGLSTGEWWTDFD
jgi:hypothetical protein